MDITKRVRFCLHGTPHVRLATIASLAGQPDVLLINAGRAWASLDDLALGFLNVQSAYGGELDWDADWVLRFAEKMVTLRGFWSRRPVESCTCDDFAAG